MYSPVGVFVKMGKKKKFEKGHKKINKYEKYSKADKFVPPTQMIAEGEEKIEAEKSYNNALRLLKIDPLKKKFKPKKNEKVHEVRQTTERV